MTFFDVSFCCFLQYICVICSISEVADTSKGIDPHANLTQCFQELNLFIIKQVWYTEVLQRKQTGQKRARQRPKIQSDVKKKLPEKQKQPHWNIRTLGKDILTEKAGHVQTKNTRRGKTTRHMWHMLGWGRQSPGAQHHLTGLNNIINRGLFLHFLYLCSWTIYTTYVLLPVTNVTNPWWIT